MVWSRLSGGDPSVPSPFGIFFFHFLNGSLAAIPFPIVAQALSRLGVGPLLPYLLGLAYGALFWVLTLFPIHRRVTGAPYRSPAREGLVSASLCGHLLYGLCLAPAAAAAGTL